MIPEAAVEAAAEWLPHSGGCEARPERDCTCWQPRVNLMRAALEAAAPHMLAESLMSAANDLAGDATDTHWDKLNADFKGAGTRVTPEQDSYLDGLEESREFLFRRARQIRTTQ